MCQLCHLFMNVLKTFWFQKYLFVLFAYYSFCIVRLLFIDRTSHKSFANISYLRNFYFFISINTIRHDFEKYLFVSTQIESILDPRALLFFLINYSAVMTPKVFILHTIMGGSVKKKGRAFIICSTVINSKSEKKVLGPSLQRKHIVG